MLEAKDITFGYAAGEPVIEGVSLAVSPGERVHVDAPSGAGKTTLARILAGYETPMTGEVLVDGDALPQRGASPVQLISQHPERVLDPRMRMRDSLREAGEVPDGLLDALGIQRAWMNRFPHELSGGEMQRFCIVRALAAHPRYLVCDEISTMLDAVTQAQIWHALVAEADALSMGVVFVSHSPALTERIATRIIHLDS